jgi:hypothetical protein
MFFKGYFMMFMNIFGKACLFFFTGFFQSGIFFLRLLYSLSAVGEMGGMKISSVGEGT